MYSSLLIFILLKLITASNCFMDEWIRNRADFQSVVEVSPSMSVIDLIPAVKYVKNDTKEFHVYCFQNVPKSIFQIWRSVELVLLDIPLQYSVYYGENETEVRDNHRSKSIFHPSFLLSASDTVFAFPAFSRYCIGIASSEKYSLLLKARTINYWKVVQMLLGIFFFISSPDLSRNSSFHYASGVTFGVSASFLILLYVLSRFIPQRGASYAVLVFGYSFALYLLKMVWHHLNDILTHYMDFVLGYCVLSAFVSFMVCYRIGPVKNQRTCNVIQWSMQLLSLMLIFFSSEYRELSTAIILLLLSLRIIPAPWIKWIKFLWYKCFPPKVKFLTEIEYIEQGQRETKRGLDNLRQYCNSPDCNVWNVVRKIKDPLRFAEFIETGNHYTDQELLDYNSEDFCVDPEDTVSDSEANSDL